MASVILKEWRTLFCFAPKQQGRVRHFRKGRDQAIPIKGAAYLSGCNRSWRQPNTERWSSKINRKERSDDSNAGGVELAGWNRRAPLGGGPGHPSRQSL